MQFKSSARAVLAVYLSFSLCLTPAMAIETSPNLILQNNLAAQQPANPAATPPMQDGSTSFAQDFNPSGSGQSDRVRPGGFGQIAGQGEFVSGDYPGAVLIPVTILGPVAKQGIHHIPTRTHLIKFLSLVGGVNSSSDLEDILIKRVGSKDKTPTETKGEHLYKEEIIHVDVEELLEEPGSRGPILQQDDLVLVKENKPMFSNNTLLTVGLVSSILGIVVSSIVISNELKK